MSLSKSTAADPRATAAYWTRDGEGASLVFTHGADVPLDMREFVHIVQSAGGRAGGREDFVQGRLPRAEDAEAIVQEFRRQAEAKLKAQSG